MSTRSASVWLGALLAVTSSFVGAQAENKSPTLDDDLKALQGVWRHASPELKAELIIAKNGFRFKSVDSFSQGVFELQEKEKKRYIAVGIDKASVAPVWRYRLAGDKLIITAFDDKEERDEFPLVRVQEKK